MFAAGFLDSLKIWLSKSGANGVVLINLVDIGLARILLPGDLADKRGIHDWKESR